MARLIIFTFFLLGLALIMNLSKNISGPIETSERFDYNKAKLSFEKKTAELEKYKNPVKKVEKKAVVVAKGPLVELSTEQLKNGSELYKKCIVCHGKMGQGKKSQKAPAIGGQFDWYLADQVINIRDGSRVNKVMMPYVRKLTDSDIKDLAAYISKLPHMGKR